MCRLTFEEFEARHCLSTLAFAAHDIVLRQTNRPVSAFAVDLDGDGDVDVISGSEGDHKIAWYENTDGKGAFGKQKVISLDASEVRSVHAADLDGDWDMDVLSASSGDHKIAWYENTDGKGGFGEQQVISTAASRARSVFAADVDGDGDVDVLSASRNDNKIAWYENVDGNGLFGPQRVIAADAVKAHSVHAADMDGDGDVDVLSAMDGNVKFTWYENIDGTGSFRSHLLVSSDEGSGRSIYAADVDGDGDLDVVSASVSPLHGDTISWYENADGKGSFAARQVITTSAKGAHSVFAADVDGDGDVDVLSASYGDNKIAWYENTDGEGDFGPQQVISHSAANARSVQAADMDGDGDVDVLAGSKWGDKISWYENADGRGDFGPLHAITEYARFAKSVYAADFDGDGDMDVLSASSGDFKIAWHENTDGQGHFGPQRIISTSARFPLSASAADLDGDGDMDVLSASAGDGKIAWYENSDGEGTFGPQRVITTAAGIAQSVYATDVDGDGDMDVLSASDGDVHVAWYENIDGRGTFGWPHVINAEEGRSQSVFAADLDGDGDVDVVSASYVYGGFEVAWYENTDGKGGFDEPRPITIAESEFHSVYAADVDNDGDMDVMSASDGPNQVAWYENTDGMGSFADQRVISTEADAGRSVYATDMDLDGDVDILSASFGDNKIAWYENTDGAGRFGPQQIITTAAIRAQSVYAVDVDGDGDVDVLSASSGDDKIAWYEQLGSLTAGDANGDCHFDQRDIVQVLQAAKYLTGEAATFEQGNWNADGVFDQLDIFAALQTGNYLQGPYAARAVDSFHL